jgi:hypothetical protein
MNHHDQKNEHFKMRMDDEVEEAPIPAAVDDMRLEKLNTRVTLISILIPVLIVIVLVITYLDIKKRVVQTEDTGVMSVQSLSKDVESRFSSLSLRQAELEEAVKKMVEQNDQSFAGLQVKLDKLAESLGQVSKRAVGQKEFNAVSSDIYKKIKNISDAVEDQSAQFVSFNEGVQSKTAALNQAMVDQGAQLKALGEKLNRFEEQLLAIQREKIDKPAMDLALRLESLKVEQQLKSRIDDLKTRVEKLAKSISQRHQAAAPAPGVSPTTVAPEKPKASGSKSPTRPPDSTTPAENGIEEQTIPK